MLTKVLIANRGEIACRIVAAAREMGLKTVAVFSEADRGMPHTRLADEAVFLGPSEAALSYLSSDRLLEAAASTGADALHPGYGFRAESVELAEECASRGITFIGPRPESLSLMADKRAAREVARRAGVPVVPGFEGDTADALAAIADIGFPVLVKAALGGGGKGMSRVDEPSQLAEALDSAARVAESAFGDASVYIERMLEGARHIEVQLLGDGEGNAVHLFERECSLQRRHQKVIEESPSPGLDADVRQAMCAAAVALAREVRYLSAGTCEFLLTPGGEFYFLEMNTRIQVEHPITECVTGYDLVKAQLELAQGKELPAQESIVPRGHAIEARLTAEDVDAGFLPQAGELKRFDIPRYPNIRIDTGFETGSVVPMEYDSLLAKIIVWGRDREEAWARLRMTLDGSVVHGVKTNLPLLRHLTRDPDVAAGALSTTLLEETIMPRYLAARDVPVPPLLLAAAALDEMLGGAQQIGSSTANTVGAGYDGNPFRRLGRFRLGVGE